MDIKAGIQTAIILAIFAGAVYLWVGIQTIGASRRLVYYRLRQQRVSQGWRMIITALALGVVAFTLGRWGEPVIYSFYDPSPTPTLTPTITLTPTVTLTPTITLTPSLTNTPSITDTPTMTPTPFVPALVATLYTSSVTPAPNAIFSQLVFARNFNPTTYEAIGPATVFINPITSLVAIFSYDKMTPGAQWTAIWYRNGELVFYETQPWDGQVGGYGYTVWEPESKSEWLAGEYEVQIFVGLDWVVVGRFTVEGDPPTKVPTPTVTFTPSPSRTPVPTLTPSITLTRAPTTTLTPSRTLAPSPTLRPSNTPRPTDTQWPTSTP